MAAKHIVKCKYCGEQFDTNIEPFVKISNRYAHEKCSQEHEANISQEEKDKQALEEYIKKLFNIKSLDGKIKKQIKDYIEKDHYTYSGIQRSLVYFFEVKQNDISKANGGIGIVGYIYQNAYNYYYALWEARQRNADKDIETYIPKVKEIVIKMPKVKIKKRKLFSFLDEEGE